MGAEQFGIEVWWQSSADDQNWPLQMITSDDYVIVIISQEYV